MKNDARVDALEKRLEAAREERDRLKDRLKEGINKRLAEHTFHTSGDQVWQVGWSSPTIRFWCDRCRTPWPCQTYHDLKSLYGEVTEWGGDLTRYAPLELRLEEPSHDAISVCMNAPGCEGVIHAWGCPEARTRIQEEPA